jgi:hypothetical protein
VGQLARRLNSRYLIGPTKHVLKRVEEVEAGEFDADIDELKRLDRKTLQERYEGREVKL